MNKGIYLFRNLSIYTNTIQKNQGKISFFFYVKINFIFILIGDISDCTLTAIPSLSDTEQLISPDFNNLETDVSKEGVMISGVESIDSYQNFLQQIAYISRSPVAYVDRSFALSCAGVSDQVFTNEIRVTVRINHYF
jgi:hypothetical protein